MQFNRSAKILIGGGFHRHLYSVKASAGRGFPCYPSAKYDEVSAQPDSSRLILEKGES